MAADTAVVTEDTVVDTAADMEVDMGEATVEVMAAVMAEVTAAAMVATTGRSAMSNFHPFSHVFNLYTTNLHPSSLILLYTCTACIQ